MVCKVIRVLHQMKRDCNFNGVTPETEETPVTDVTAGQDQGGAELPAADEQLLRELTERARSGGLRLTGEGGLLGRLTKWWSRARWKASSMTTSGTGSMTQRAAMAGIPALATAPNGAHPYRAGGNQRAARPGVVFRAEDRR